jgi:hypothetical protein
MKQSFLIYATILFIAIAIVANIYAYNSNKTECQKFAKSQGSSILSIERHWTTIGTPYYWKDKNTLIWEVKLSNGETWFMRPNFLFKNDWEKN